MQQSICLFSMHQCYLKWKKNQFEIVTMLRHWDNEKRTELPGMGTCEAEAWRYQMENSKRRKSSTWEEIAMNWSDINTSMSWQFYLETSSATLTSARTIWLISKQLSALLGTCCFLQHCFFSTNPAEICPALGWYCTGAPKPHCFRNAGIQDSACSLTFAVSWHGKCHIRKYNVR